MKHILDESSKAVSIGHGPIANNCEGGHFIEINGLRIPRWIVSTEAHDKDFLARSGHVFDSREKSMGMWELRDNELPFDAEYCRRMPLDGSFLYLIKVFTLNTKTSEIKYDYSDDMISAVADHIIYHWEERDGSQFEEPDQNPRQMSNRAVHRIDREALELLGALYAGAKAESCDDGNWIIEDRKTGEERAKSKPRLSGEDRQVPEDIYEGRRGSFSQSAMNQLVHNRLTSPKSLYGASITRRGMLLAQSLSLPGHAPGNVAEGETVPEIDIVDERINEPFALELRKEAELAIKGGETRYDTMKFIIPAISRDDFTVSINAGKLLLDLIVPAVINQEETRNVISETIGVITGNGEVSLTFTNNRAYIPYGPYTMVFKGAQISSLRAALKYAAKRGGTDSKVAGLAIRSEHQAYYS